MWKCLFIEVISFFYLLYNPLIFICLSNECLNRLRELFYNHIYAIVIIIPYYTSCRTFLQYTFVFTNLKRNLDYRSQDEYNLYHNYIIDFQNMEDWFLNVQPCQIPSICVVNCLIFFAINIRRLGARYTLRNK